MRRRELLRFLAGSPLWMGMPQLEAERAIASPEDAFSVFDFERVARETLPPAHWGYLATGVDGDVTLRANREGFNKFPIRARRLVNVKDVDTSVEIFGTPWETPIVLAPVGSQRAFHPDGEVAAARAAKSKRHLQILSTMTTSSVEEVIEARGAAVTPGGVSTEAVQREQHRARVCRMDHVPTETEPCQHARSEVLQHDVALAREIDHQIDTSRLAQINAQRALSDIRKGEKAGHAAIVPRRNLPDLVTTWRLDLDDVRTEVREDAADVRARDDTREIEHSHIGERRLERLHGRSPPAPMCSTRR